MRPTPLQPIQFEPNTDTCCPDAFWTQEIFPDDTLSVQFIVDAEDFGDEEVDNPDINQPQAQYITVQETVLNLIEGGIGLFDGAEVEQSITLTEGQWYAVEVGIVYPFEGNTFNPSNVIVSGFQEDLVIPASTGVFTVYGIWAGGGEVSIRRQDLAQTAPANVVLKLNRFSIKEVIAPSVAVRTPAGINTDVVGSFVDYPYVTSIIDTTTISQDFDCFSIDATNDAGTVYVSNTINIVPPSNCYIRMMGCGNNNFFKAGFQPTLRVKGKLIDDGPVYERSVYRNSKGGRRLNYGWHEQAKLLGVERCPEFIRKYLYLLPMFETVAIQIGQNDPSSYFALEEVEKDTFASGDDQLAGVQCRMVHKEKLIESIFAEACTPVLPPVVLGEAKTDTAITNEDEDQLIRAQ